MPFTRIEIATFGIVDDRLAVLLARREEAPCAGQWALPGGAIRIDLDDDLDAAARRVVRERLDVAASNLQQVCAAGGRTRDPRAPWAVSIVYRTLVRAVMLEARAGKRITALRWTPVEAAVRDTTLAFDHNRLIAQAVEATRADVDRLELPADLLPESFTLGELQAACESILARRLDKSSFRRRLAERDVLEPLRGALRTGAFRPAQLYRCRPQGRTPN